MDARRRIPACLLHTNKVYRVLPPAPFVCICAGCLKNVLVVWGGILQGDTITPRELQGYGIALLGFAMFSLSRLRGGAGQSRDAASPPVKSRRQRRSS